MKCFLIAEKLSHSFSKPIHNELSDYSYEYKELKKEELFGFFKEKDFDGLNVTIPYKEEVIKYIDTLSPEAQKIGAVNTVLNKNGKLFGYNTDYYGFSYLLKEIGADVKGKKVSIIGKGGAAKTVKCVCEDMGAESVLYITRNDISSENFAPFLSSEIIINATPVGMYPHNGESAVDISLFTKCEALLDLIYNPSDTKIMLDAQKRGVKTINGLSMLVAQAKKASELFTGKEIEDSEIERIKGKIERQTKNIVLIGMPGCGKTTIGKELAKILERPFFDSDEEIEKTGNSPAFLIENFGEEYFRKEETKVLSKLCKMQGAVIATGGGCVTIEENIDILRQNAFVIFVKRELKALDTKERPLSKGGEEALLKLQEKRLPLYKKTAHFEIENSEDCVRAAEKIISLLE